MKQYITSLAYFVSLIFLLSNCTIKEEIAFKKDYSGNFRYTLDLSGMSSMMSAMPVDDSLKKKDLDMPQEMVDGLTNNIKTVAGVQNFKVLNSEKGKLIFSFDFKDINTLNKAYNQLARSNKLLNEGGKKGGSFMPGMPPMEEDSTEEKVEEPIKPITPEKDFEYFTKQGKSIIYRRPQVDMDSKELKGMGSQLEMLKGMGDFLKMETIISFEKKVKKISVKDLEGQTQDDNTVVLKLNLANLSQGAKPEAVIKIK